MHEEQGMDGSKLAVIAVSRQRADYVSVEDAVLFALFPDRISRQGRPRTVARLSEIRLSIDNDRVVGQCAKWWDAAALQKQCNENPRRHARAAHALVDLRRALERRYASPFGNDLPIYVDSASGCARSLDWDSLEWDVVRGMNSKVPFRYHLSQRVRNRITKELPWLDRDEHFRTAVPDDTVVSLIRQLLEQHTKEVRSMSLIPARWIAKIHQRDRVVVAVGVPYVFDTDLGGCVVDIGALRVNLDRVKKHEAPSAAAPMSTNTSVS